MDRRKDLSQRARRTRRVTPLRGMTLAALGTAGLLLAAVALIGTVTLLDRHRAYRSPLAMNDRQPTPRQEALLGLRDFGPESEPKLADLAPELTDFVNRGREIVHGDGLCLNCHRIGPEGDGTNGPDLDGIGSWAGRRLRGLDSAEYLVQSLLDPEAYVVSGYFPTMISARRPPLRLDDEEILMVVAYLQSLGGHPTVTPETDLAEVMPRRAGSVAEGASFPHRDSTEIDAAAPCG